MGKGSGRKTSEREAVTSSTAGEMPTLTPEEAERASLEIVPLWQLDEADFAAGPGVAGDDLRALAAPLIAPVTLQLTPAPSIGAIAPLPSPHKTLSLGLPPPEPGKDGVDVVIDAAPVVNGEGSDLATRATMRLEAHAPLAPRKTEPELPSIMVDGPAVELPPAPPAPPPVELPSPVVTAPLIAVAAAAQLGEPREPSAPPRPKKKKKPGAIPGSSAARARGSAPDMSSSGNYKVPRSKTPLIVGSSVAVVVAALGIYLMSGGTSSAKSGEATDTVVTRPEPQGPKIPPPPPADEAPESPAVSRPSPVSAVAQQPPRVQQAVTPSVAQAPLAPNPFTPPAPPPPAPHPPPRSTPAIAAAPPAPRKPAPQKPASAGGAIVRDNPF
jgi:hypothetical protein